MTEPFGPRRWLIADAVRVLGALSVPLAWALVDATAAAVLLLVLGGAVVARTARLPQPVDTAVQLVLLAAGWFAALGAYDAIPGLDLATHVAAGAALGLLARALLLRARLLPDGRGRCRATARILHTTTAVIALGLLWELGEWAGHIGVSSAIGVGYEDTLSDLVADLVGAAVAVSAWELVARRRRAS
ncbi:hypothetical protein [Agrococcus beijingensis]|uniref:hypothetical protein n=1 Tax=Agrococcus beijingensis TaxID=3068634 RepID=UPI0027428D81|nr:hypothetical protein [Agrococcus sp. REN33]